MRLIFNEICNTDRTEIDKNLKANAFRERVVYRPPAYPVCAVVGAGPSLKNMLPVLREWVGDIFAVNDTAGYLSDQGIPSYLYMMDATNEKVRTGINIKGAVLASRCNPVNFIYNNIRTWDMIDDLLIPGKIIGVEGGPSAAGRAPHLFLRMGYKGIAFFGCDSSFFDVIHLSGERPEARDSLLIVRVDGMDYITNAAMFTQAKFLSGVIRKHPNFLFNCSDGLLKAMVANGDEWDIVAIGQDLRDKYEESGYVWNTPYTTERRKVWQPNA